MRRSSQRDNFCSDIGWRSKYRNVKRDIFLTRKISLFYYYTIKCNRSPKNCVPAQQKEGGCPDNNSSNGSKSKILRLFINNRIFDKRRKIKDFCYVTTVKALKFGPSMLCEIIQMQRIGDLLRKQLFMQSEREK